MTAKTNRWKRVRGAVAATILTAGAFGSAGAWAEAAATPEAVPAQDAPSAQPAPAEPSQADRQRNSAAKLAGLVLFVGQSCPEAQPDYERFKAVVSAMGVNVDDLSKGELMVRAATYVQAYQKDTAESCRRAFELFGEKGTTIPGLINRKAS